MQWSLPAAQTFHFCIFHREGHDLNSVRGPTVFMEVTMKRLLELAGRNRWLPASINLGRNDDLRMGTLFTDDFSSARVVLLGFPHDEGCTRNGGRPGAALGPQAFRRFVTALGPTCNPEHRIDLTSSLGGGVYDAGDVVGNPPTLEAAHCALEEAVALVLQAGKVPFVIGGGNDQSAPNGRGAYTFLDSVSHPSALGIINIDAHLDVRPLLGDDHSIPHSGSPFRELLLHPRSLRTNGGAHFVEYACQGQQCSQEHADFVTAHGGTLMWLTRDIHRVADSFPKAMDIAGDHIFVSFDIDAVQGSDCPGVSCPGSVGLTAQDAMDISRMAGKNPKVLLMDVSELNPVVEDYRSPRLAVMMFYHFLLGLAERGSS
jgi:formiminoglutamase